MNIRKPNSYLHTKMGVKICISNAFVAIWLFHFEEDLFRNKAAAHRVGVGNAPY